MIVRETTRISRAGWVRRQGDVVATEAEGGNPDEAAMRLRREEEENVETGQRDLRVRSWRKGAKRTRRSDSGPVINEESNFQAGDLTSSRPTVAATQCEMEHEKVVE